MLPSLSVIAGGNVSYREYKPRVINTKIIVDEYLRTPDHADAALRSAIGDTMGFYALASSVWDMAITTETLPHYQPDDLKNNPLNILLR